MAARLAQPARDLACYGLFLLLAAVLFREALLDGLVQWQDDSRYFYFPLFSTVAAALRQGYLPLWTPDLFSGYPLFADGEAGMLYPFHLLAFPALRPEAAVVALRLLRFTLASVFTYHFLRALGSGRFGGIVAGTAFMLSGFTVAEVVHANLSTGFIWLPLVLYFLERAAQARAPSRYLYAMFGGVALAIQALAVHVQVSLMTGLVAGPYLAMRVYWNDVFPPLRRPWRTFPRRLARRTLVLLSLGAVFGATAAGLAAVQLLPLYELGQHSARGGGLGSSAATINSVTPFELLSLVFPHLFDGSDGRYLGYWIPWDTAIYAGRITLLLALVGVLFHRGRAAIFFAIAAVTALTLALGRYGPPLVQQAVELVLGEYGLRSPGRFGGVLDFSLAVLAGLGAHWLDSRLVRAGRWERRAFGAFLATAALVVAAVLLAARRALELVQTQPDAVRQWLAHQYLAFDPEGAPKVNADQVLRDLQQALEPTHPRMLLAIVALIAGVALPLAWLCLGALGQWAEGKRQKAAAGPRQSTLLSVRRLLLALPRAVLRALPVAAAVFLAVDLLATAEFMHPRVPLAAARPQSSATAFLRQQFSLPPAPAQSASQPDAAGRAPMPSDGHALWRVETGLDVYLYSFDLEPNALLPLRISEAGGYSSLNSVSRSAYQGAAEFTDNRLLDLWNARFLVRANRGWSLPSHELTPFHPSRPLLSGSGYNTGASAHYVIPRTLTENVRVVSALRDAWLVPQGQPVAEITAVDTAGERLTWKLRAGQEAAEATFDWARHRGRTQHARPQPVFSWTETDAVDDSDQPVHLYYAKFPLDRPRTLVALEVRALPLPDVPDAIVRVYGVALGLPNWQTEAVEWWMSDKYRLAYQDKDVQIFENLHALPRAYLVPEAVALPANVHLKQMAERAFDPEQFVLVDPPSGFTTGSSLAVSSSPEAASGSGFPIPRSEPSVPNPQPSAPGPRFKLASPDESISPHSSLVTQHSLGRIAWSPAGRSEVVEYQGERVVVDVDAAAPSWLFLGDVYYPGWRAYVDGVERPILRADLLFRAVGVPRGQHRVEFRFEPRSVQLGALASVTTGLIVLMTAILGALRRSGVQVFRRSGALITHHSSLAALPAPALASPTPARHPDVPGRAAAGGGVTAAAGFTRRT